MLNIGDIVKPKDSCIYNNYFFKIVGQTYSSEELTYYTLEPLKLYEKEYIFLPNNLTHWTERDLEFIASEKEYNVPFEDEDYCIKRIITDYLNKTLKNFNDFMYNENKIIDDKIDMEENNMLKILEIYKEKQIKEIETKYDKQLEKLEFDDPINTIIREMTKEMNNQIKTICDNENIEEPISITCDLLSIEFTKDTLKKKNEIIDKIKLEKKQLNNKIEEINALLELSPNYEEKIKILKAYDILDKKTGIMK